MKNIQAKLQTFAGAMMVPIILLVLVGFFVGIGSAFTCRKEIFCIICSP